jgi:hypothetical protein
MIVAFVWLYAWALGEFVLQLTYEDFQDQVYEDLKTKHTRTLIFSFQSNEASVLEYIAPIFSIYSIELEFHDKSVWSVNLCLGWLELFYAFLKP